MGMGLPELKDIIEKHKKWLASEPDGERADLSNADLRYADLSNADLSNADLRYANLSNADLSNADLSNADLSNADLSNADLRYANLRYANLRYADLSNADLSNADLSNADLRYADLSNADLRYADLRYADLSNADLRYADLSNADLRYVKKDFFERMTLAKNEIVALYDAIVRGKIDGSSYSGECACFAGTIAKPLGEKADSGRTLSNGLVCDPSSPTERWFVAIRAGHTPESNAVAKVTKEWVEEFAKANAIELPKYKLVSSLEFAAAFPQSVQSPEATA